MLDGIWWTWRDSNSRPLPCHGSASLPKDCTELITSINEFCVAAVSRVTKQGSVTKTVVYREAD